jgi:hypothetical protein
LLGASFRPSLTTTPLRSATVHRYPVLCGLSPPVIKHAWHTSNQELRRKPKFLADIDDTQA